MAQPPTRHLRVLCLEDSPADADLVGRALTAAGYVVHMSVAAGREDFEELVSADVYDVILADFSLPDFDGHAALALAKTACPATPFICVSGTIGEEATVELLKQGADDCVLKDRMARLPFAVERAIAEKTNGQVLRESEKRYREVLEFGGVGVAYYSLDGRVLMLNRRAVQNLGGSDSGQFVGKYLTELFGEEAGNMYVKRLGKTAASPEPLEYIDHVELPIGPRWLASIHTRSLDIEGNVAGVHVYAQDITERKQAEEELRRRSEQLRRTVEGAVLAMSHMVESRDPYTAGHERRVAELAAAIGSELGIEGAQLEALRLACTIHDIGKIAVPAEILSKPGRLSSIEFELIKAHSQAAYDILQPIDFDFPLADIVVQHHERLDGSGYPSGLAGDAILLEARILAVADVVEAMISHRPYRAALPLEEAMAELAGGAGTRYDAAACEAAIRLFREQGFAFSE